MSATKRPKRKLVEQSRSLSCFVTLCIFVADLFFSVSSVFSFSLES